LDEVETELLRGGVSGSRDIKRFARLGRDSTVNLGLERGDYTMAGADTVVVMHRKLDGQFGGVGEVPYDEGSEEGKSDVWGPVI